MKKPIRRNLTIAIVLLICSIFAFKLATDFFQDKAFGKLVSSELSKNKITNKDLVGKTRRVYTERKYWVYDLFPFSEFDRRLKKSLEKAGFWVTKEVRKAHIKGEKELREEASYSISEQPSYAPIFRLTLIHRVPSPKVEPPQVTAKPKVVIVLDDWGYNIKNLNDILQIKRPLTLSILPNLPYSAVVARKAKENNFEVILHMPMEPKNKMKLELNTLYTTMSEEEIKTNLEKALKSVPYADGVSNHEGSKATEDERLMRVVFGELKKYDLFFFDSLVTNESVCEPLAKEAKIRFAKRSIFLDNESDPEYIRKQFEKLIDMAIKTGEVIGIGHDRPNTVAVLRQMVTELTENGIELTYLSDLAR